MLFRSKGEKDKAIIFVNKAIEIDGNYLKIIPNEEIFYPIKQYIKISGKGKEVEEKKELGKKEKEVQDYLEETYILIKDINENEVKNRINEKVDNIFKKEELKRIQREAEKDINFEFEESFKTQKEKDY